MPISLPALRERMEDLPEIAKHLAERIGSSQGRRVSLTEPAMRRLMQHKWPGNIRELENCLERASVMSDSGVIDADQIRIDRMRDSHSANSGHSAHGIHVPHHGLAQPHAGGGNGSSPSPASQPMVDVNDPTIDERTRVVAALEQAGWVQAKAARLLGMTPRQIAYRIQTLNIEVKQF
jgi:Nif-specific regulatory protein